MKPILGILCSAICLNFVHVVAELKSKSRAEKGASSNSPLQQVITLLEGMLANSKTEKRDEMGQFAAYKQWCSDFDTDKGRDIAEASEKIAVLKSGIAQYQADIDKFANDLAKHDQDISVWEADKVQAEKVRVIEHTDYVTLHSDYSSSITALSNAIEHLNSTLNNTGVFVEVSNVRNAKLIPQDVKTALDLFLTQDLRNASTTASTKEINPYGSGYQFSDKSYKILEMMGKLHDGLVEQKREIELKENNAVRAHSALDQDLTEQIANANTLKDEKSTIKSEKEAAKAADEGTVSSMTSTLNADISSKKDTAATCAQKASDFNERSKLRAEEIASIETVLKILNGDSVTGIAAKHSVYLSTGTALAQLRASSPTANQERVQKFLKSQATRLHSQTLAVVAEHLGNHQQRDATHPLVPVLKMIKDLIVKLTETATEEAGHKKFCDAELTANTGTRTEKSEAVEQLHADMDTLTASIEQLGLDIQGLIAAMAGLDKDMADATVLRQKEKAENDATIEDSMRAQTAVEKALITIKHFYDKANQATVLLQRTRKAKQATVLLPKTRNSKQATVPLPKTTKSKQAPVLLQKTRKAKRATVFMQKARKAQRATVRMHGKQAPPEIFDTAFKGAQSQKASVVSLLEAIQGDFKTLEVDTKTAEQTAVSTYEEFIKDSNNDKDAKQLEKETKEKEKWKDSSKLINVKRDLEATQKELDAALKYYDKIKSTCIDASTSFNDRVAARSSEIDSLQLAFRMLNGEDINP